MTISRSVKSMLPLAIAAATALTTTTTAQAKHRDFEIIEFSEQRIFFELNNTDGDLGIHALIDGDPWRVLYITDPRNRVLLSVRNSGRLARQGLTEIFFESAEPTFDELSPEDFFHRFPQGKYNIHGIGQDRSVRLVGEDIISHVMPAPVDNILVSGVPIPEDSCEEEPAVIPAGGELVVSWDPVTESHPDLGAFAPGIVVDRYQVVLEREEPTALKFTYDLGPTDGTSLTIPAGLINPGDELKVEVLVRTDTWNQTASELCMNAE